MSITNEKLRSWIQKSYRRYVVDIDQDSEVWEVLLKDGYASVDGETVWTFGKEHYENGDYTQARIKADLRDWLDQIWMV